MMKRFGNSAERDEMNKIIQENEIWGFRPNVGSVESKESYNERDMGTENIERTQPK